MSACQTEKETVKRVYISLVAGAALSADMEASTKPSEKLADSTARVKPPVDLAPCISITCLMLDLARRSGESREPWQPGEIEIMKDTASVNSSFSTSMKSLHWAIAVLVLLMIYGGFTLSRETATLHFGFGIVILALMVIWQGKKANNEYFKSMISSMFEPWRCGVQGMNVFHAATKFSTSSTDGLERILNRHQCEECLNLFLKLYSLGDSGADV